MATSSACGTAGRRWHRRATPAPGGAITPIATGRCARYAGRVGTAPRIGWCTPLPRAPRAREAGNRHDRPSLIDVSPRPTRGPGGPRSRAASCRGRASSPRWRPPVPAASPCCPRPRATARPRCCASGRPPTRARSPGSASTSATTTPGAAAERAGRSRTPWRTAARAVRARPRRRARRCAPGGPRGRAAADRRRSPARRRARARDARRGRRCRSRGCARSTASSSSAPAGSR